MKIIDYEELKKNHYFFMQKPCYANFVFILIIAGLFVAFVFWLFFASLNDVISADVLIRPNQDISSVRSEISGKIKEKKYINNQFVQKGDILIVLDTSSNEFELNKINEQLKVNLSEQNSYEDLIKTIDGKKMQILESYDGSNTRAISYLSELNRIITEVEEAKLKLKNEKELPSLFVSEQDIILAENFYNQKLLYMNSYIEDSKNKALNSLNNLVRDYNILNENKMSIINEINKSIIRSPIDGNIKEFRPLNEGEMLFSGDNILELIPENNSKLRAEIYIKTADIVRVKIGDKVRIKLSGIPPAKFGYVDGVVSLIPHDYSLTAYNEMVFIVEAKLEKPFFTNRTGNSEISIKSGSSGNCKIIVGTQKAIVMLLRKLDFLW